MTHPDCVRERDVGAVSSGLYEAYRGTVILGRYQSEDKPGRIATVTRRKECKHRPFHVHRVSFRPGREYEWGSNYACEHRAHEAAKKYVEGKP